MTDLRDALRRTSSKHLRGALERTQERAGQGRRTPPSSLVWQGPWNPDVRYTAGDVVGYEGSSWRALIAHTNVKPPPLPAEVSEVWELVARKGEQGSPGARGFTGATGPAGAGSELEIEDEGIALGTATTVDFVGAGVTASVVGSTATITIPGGGGGGHVIEDEGVPLPQRADMNFVGAGVTATDVAGVTVVTIPGGTGAGDAYTWQSTPSLAVSTGQRFYADRDGTIEFCRAERSAGDGSGTATLDVLLNGVSIFPVSPKPTVAAGSFLGVERIPDTVAFLKGDYFEIEIEITGGGTGPLRLTTHFS